jgi:predicted porin
MVGRLASRLPSPISSPSRPPIFEGQRRGYLRADPDGKCSKVGVGLTYDLSKRTRFYADAATLTEAKAAHCALNTNFDIIGNSGSSDNAQSGAYGATGFNAGIRHSF